MPASECLTAYLLKTDFATNPGVEICCRSFDMTCQAAQKTATDPAQMVTGHGLSAVEGPSVPLGVHLRYFHSGLTH